MKADRPVCIIILAWNGVSYTRACLESLRAKTEFDDYRVIVVDNGSSDGTGEYLASLDWVTVVRHSGNLGFMRGINQAIRRCPPDCDILLLNNDTEIIQADWLRRMQHCALSAADIGIVGCRLRRPSGILQHAGAYMPPTYWGQQTGSGEPDINQFHRDRDTDAVVFACAYIKRGVIDEVGLLDEAYVSYFEDTDYCYRAREAGYRTVCCGSVTVLETDRIPADWVAAANRMDEVWVPSTFNRETFRNSGVTRPIHIVPLGVDPDYFHPEIHSRRPTGAFTFLSVFEWGERKAPEILLRAFNEEFHRRENVVLICKTTNSDPGVDIAAQVRDLRLKRGGGGFGGRANCGGVLVCGHERRDPHGAGGASIKIGGGLGFSEHPPHPGTHPPARPAR